jgi:hypothetical protein
MPTREDAAKLQQETERLRTTRLERERRESEEKGRSDKQEKEDEVREQNSVNLESVQTSTRKLDDLNVRQLWLRTKLENWDERNTQFRDLGTGTVVGHLAMVGGLAGCVIADTIILSTPSRLISRGFRESLHSTLGNADWIVPAIAFVFASAYFAAEFAIGYQLTGERREQIGPISDRAFAYIAWLTLPLLTFAYTLINSGVLSNDPFRVVGPGALVGGITSSVALGTAALVVHGFVLYFSGAIALGLAYICYKIRQLILRFQINRTLRQISRVAVDAETGFRRFVNYFRANNNGNGPGPFPETTTRVINDLYGSEVIEEPNRRHRNTDRRSRTDQETGDATERNDGDRKGTSDGKEERTDQTESDEPGPGFSWEGEDEL